MKKAVVYYSMAGNTDYVAKRIAEKTGADLIRIVPKKAYPSNGFIKFMWGGQCAVMGQEPKLEEYEFDADKYDEIILGTPVWASTFTPPIRTFIKENKEKLNGKKISLFICYSGGGADKAEEKLKEFLGISGFANTLVLVDPLEKKTEEKDKQIEEFCEKIGK